MKSSRIIAVTIFSVAMVAAVWIGGKYFNKARGHAKTVSVVARPTVTSPPTLLFGDCHTIC